MQRREFLKLSALSATAAVAGCATNPVTGKKQLMLMTQEEEINVDKEVSPHQFSADYGPVQERKLNDYITQVGSSIAAKSHRVDMPYNFRCVNASYVNAYTFPGGSMATTRGILLALSDEAQLAALLGHEITHVTARHTSEAMSKSLLITGALIGVAILVEAGTDTESYTPWVEGLGFIGAGLLLARYSRDNEREADKYGLEYAVRAGYPADGMVGLMDVLRNLQKGKPNVIERMFASHPWSQERYDAAVQRATVKYPASRGLPANRDRYMDMTASIRAQKAVIEAIQKGDEAAEEEKYDQALGHYLAAVQAGPADYEALTKAGNTKVIQEKPAESLDFFKRAREAYPEEPQALHLLGVAHIELKRYDEALAEFTQYEEKLPGNPYTVFYRGRSLDGLGRKEPAAEAYQKFLQEEPAGAEAEYARKRLKEWGYVLPAA